MSKRVELFRTLILSKLLYAAESWVLHEAKMRHYIHVALIRLYKRLIRDCPGHLGDADVLWLTGLPDPAELLRQCRLRIWVVFTPVVQLLPGDSSIRIWHGVVWSEMTSLGCGSSYVTPPLFLIPWLILVTGFTSCRTTEGTGSGSFDEPSTMPGAQRKNLYIVERLHWDILTTLHDHGFLHLDPPREVHDKGTIPHACMQCGICFKKSRRLWCTSLSGPRHCQPSQTAL